MKRFVVIIIIALITVAVMLLIFRPELLEDVWLWIVGLIGVIIGYSKTLIDKIKKWTDNEPEAEQPDQKSQSSINEENKEKVILTLLRYSDDGSLTTGMLYLKDEFFCYTYEDSKDEQEISSTGRILAGKYPIGFEMNETDFTLKYRLKFNWFNFHLQVKKSGNDEMNYIHCGATNTETINGILLQEEVYEKLYKKIADLINAGENVFIQICDETWFSDRFC